MSSSNHTFTMKTQFATRRYICYGMKDSAIQTAGSNFLPTGATPALILVTSGG